MPRLKFTEAVTLHRMAIGLGEVANTTEPAGFEVDVPDDAAVKAAKEIYGDRVVVLEEPEKPKGKAKEKGGE